MRKGMNEARENGRVMRGMSYFSQEVICIFNRSRNLSLLAGL